MDLRRVGLAHQLLLEMSTLAGALDWVCSHPESLRRSTFIMTPPPSEVLRDCHALQREVVKRREAPVALAKLAEYVCENAGVFVLDGPRRLPSWGR